MQKSIVVIKIGTNAILDENGDVDTKVLKNLAKGIMEIREKGYFSVVVSSGAVGAARKELDTRRLRQISKSELKQIRSAIGQPRLMKCFRQEFKKYDVPIAQGLVTRSDFSSRSQQLSMRNILHKMFLGGILPVMNENDFLTPGILGFSDNDQLAGFFAGMLQAHFLVLLSNVDGLFTGNPKNANTKKIDIVSEITPKIESYISQEKSDYGLGGMQSKIETAKIVNQLGINMVLASSREKDVLQKIISREHTGTRFLTKYHKKKSGIRVWLAAGATECGSIILDPPLEKILQEKKSGISLLGIGVRTIVGEFSAGDAIGIFSETGKQIGRGAAKITSKKMKDSLKEGNLRGKVFVHADCLFLL